VNAPDIPAELIALAERLGRVEFDERLRKEQCLVDHQGQSQNHGVFRFDNWFDFYGLVKIGLKVSGLWARGLRNYLDIQIESNEVFLERLPAAFDGFRILQLTDLHADLHPDFVASVRSVVDEVGCDLIVVTGDFRTCTFGDHSGATEASIQLLSGLPMPCLATLGNHDFLAKVLPLEAAGVRFLLNESITFKRAEAELHVVGIDDPNYYKTHNFARALTGVPVDGCKVLLSHAPQTYQHAAECGIDFQMSGHTHGGQICLPGGRVVVHDGSSPRRLLSGPWREGVLQGYTSRGTGASGLPVRLNCPAEVTVHTLRSVNRVK
jgi:predicted MPP superfamily phosphohydrolase